MRLAKQLVFLATLAILLAGASLAAASGVAMYFTPEWKDKADQAKQIAAVLSKESGLEITPTIAKNYPEIITAFSSKEPVMAYAGSFIQAVLLKKGLSVPLLQGIDGKESYQSVLVVRQTAGTDPKALVKDAGELIAYAAGASSGESGAKAASGGKATLATYNHAAALGAVRSGKAKAAFLKSWWWESHKGNYQDMVKLDYPGVTEKLNPDNILSANKALSPAQDEKLRAAASNNAKAFSVQSFRPVSVEILTPSLELMEMGKIDPMTYKW